ncbi:MAG: hypothetical protein GWO08_01230, partial [Gammaproteobacteria bacterium]|nr:hypothetical protein [Gammaproteobacteria bacterium]NIR92332.1 hypothetical protein [Gammaproteobacteria bacterium]
ALRRIRKRLAISIVCSFVLTPVIGYTTAWFFGMIRVEQLVSTLAILPPTLTTLLLLGALCFFFHRYFRPVFDWLGKQRDNTPLP